MDIIVAGRWQFFMVSLGKVCPIYAARTISFPSGQFIPASLPVFLP